MRRAVELFLRGEFWLHLTTMFLIQVVLVAILKVTLNYDPSVYVLFTFPVVVGIAKELYDKYHDEKHISISDIIGTTLGGALATVILEYML